MAWPQRPFIRAVLDLSGGPDATFGVPEDDHSSPLDWHLPSGEVIRSPRGGWNPGPEIRYPADLWRNGGRERAPFGTKAVEMSLAQAKLRKLVVHSPLFQGLVRTCPGNPRAEDRLMEAYDQKRAAKAKAKAA